MLNSLSSVIIASLAFAEKHEGRLDALPDAPYLAIFKQAFARHGRYVLAPTFLVGGQFRPALDFSMEEPKIHIRQVQDIRPDDLDQALFDAVGQN
jgi:hypothetical protein